MSNNERYLRVREVAKILGVSVSHLNKLRGDGAGPPFCKLGAAIVIYPESMLHDWVATRVVRHTPDE